MSLTVLLPHEVAARCFISEALMWIAFQRLPLRYYGEHEEDGRLNFENSEGLEPSIVEEPVTDAECERVGLPPNPEYKDFEAGVFHRRPDDIRRLLEIDGIPDASRRQLKRDLEKAVPFQEKLDEWTSDFDMFMEAPKAKVFLALREGELKASGMELPRPTIAGSHEHYEAEGWNGWDDSQWSEIDSEFWTMGGLNWADCTAEGRLSAYAMIIVDVDQLLAKFPPALEPSRSAVVKIGDTLVLTQDEEGAKTRSRRGRPAYLWDEFFLEVTKRLQAGSLPAKQEAFIVEMQEWCSTAWGREVARSTVLQKLKPYYDNFVRGSENSNP